jgi:hypothetical protein
MERRHHRFGDLACEFLFLLLGFPGQSLTMTWGMAFSYWAGRERFSNTSFATGIAEKAFGQPA